MILLEKSYEKGGVNEHITNRIYGGVPPQILEVKATPQTANVTDRELVWKRPKFWVR